MVLTGARPHYLRLVQRPESGRHPPPEATPRHIHGELGRARGTCPRPRLASPEPWSGMKSTSRPRCPAYPPRSATTNGLPEHPLLNGVHGHDLSIDPGVRQQQWEAKASASSSHPPTPRHRRPREGEGNGPTRVKRITSDCAEQESVRGNRLLLSAHGVSTSRQWCGGWLEVASLPESGPKVDNFNLPIAIIIYINILDYLTGGCRPFPWLDRKGCIWTTCS